MTPGDKPIPAMPSIKLNAERPSREGWVFHHVTRTAARWAMEDTITFTLPNQTEEHPVLHVQSLREAISEAYHINWNRYSAAKNKDHKDNNIHLYTYYVCIFIFIYIYKYMFIYIYRYKYISSHIIVARHQTGSGHSFSIAREGGGKTQSHIHIYIYIHTGHLLSPLASGHSELQGHGTHDAAQAVRGLQRGG